MMNIIKNVGIKSGMMLLQLLEVGAWSTVNSFTQRQAKEKSNILARDIEQGVSHQVTSLRVIKKEN